MNELGLLRLQLKGRGVEHQTLATMLLLERSQVSKTLNGPTRNVSAEIQGRILRAAREIAAVEFHEFVRNRETHLLRIAGRVR